MAEPIHAYSPEQYSTVVDLWKRLLGCAGETSYGEEDLYTLILADSDVEWRYAEKEIQFCYSSDYSGSEYDRANARTLAEEFPWLSHVDNYGAWSESFVTLLVGELPSPDTEAGIQELERLVQTVESLSDYPILDEQKLYDLEAEIEEESWDAWFLSDFASAVAGNLGCDTYELEFDFKVSDEQLKEMFYDVYSEEWELSFRLENATTGYFEGWEDVAVTVAENIIREWRKAIVDPNQLTLV
jgi:hypothetical protein